MPTITIDGRKIETSPGKMIIEAALENGIDIPHFCWHPALTVAGNCRMCLVNVGNPKKAPDGSIVTDASGNPEVQWGPKLSIACATPVWDGMIVDTSSARVEGAQNAIMEFLLINHPLDCPICDEAGQCKLQEYGFKHSKGKSRFDEQKVHKDKRVPLGPNVLFDGERCISCSRCIRFAEEVAEQPVLTFVQRGDHVTIETFPGQVFDSEYSMNVIEICPVGALTSIDFRFDARVWEMSFTDSICPGCARGCNMKIGVRNNEILRLEPKANPHVNQYWMCDTGRLTQFRFVNQDRVRQPMVRRGGELVEASWDLALETAATALRSFKHQEIVVVVSSKMTNEDLYLAKRLMSEVLKTHNFSHPLHVDESFTDTMLRCADRSANSAGIKALGLGDDHSYVMLHELAAKIKNGTFKAVLVLMEDFSDNPALLEALAAAQCVIACVSNHSNVTARAEVVLSTATYAEIEGTYTNIDSRVQRIQPAIVTKENERHMGMKMSRWDKLGAFNDRWTKGERRDCRPLWRVLSNLAASLGAKWTYTNAESVFEELAAKHTPYKGMSYDLIDEYMGLVLGKAGSPEPKAHVYESHVLKPN